MTAMTLSGRKPQSDAGGMQQTERSIFKAVTSPALGAQEIRTEVWQFSSPPIRRHGGCGMCCIRRSIVLRGGWRRAFGPGHAQGAVLRGVLQLA